MRRWLMLSVPLLIGGLAGCGQEEPARLTSEPTTPVAEVPAADWLGPGETPSPARWLAGRIAGAGADVDATAALLAAAAERYRESPRMIANRAVQLQAMLAEQGIDETAIALIGWLGGLPAQGRVSFSADCQHYFNLRVQGLDREQALARLSAPP